MSGAPVVINAMARALALLVALSAQSPQAELPGFRRRDTMPA